MYLLIYILYNFYHFLPGVCLDVVVSVALPLVVYVLLPLVVSLVTMLVPVDSLTQEEVPGCSEF